MAKRVLWVVKGLGPGGAERLLVAAAAAHDPDRFDIECAYVLPWKDHLAGELEAAGVLTHCLSRTRRDLRWPIRLWQMVRSGGFDVVHLHSPLPGSVARLAARSLPPSERPGVVSTEHNRWETHRAPTRLLNRLTSRWDDRAVAVTDEVAASMRGPIREIVAAVRHGIDVDGVRAALADRATVRRELGLGDDELVVGTVANYRPQKDYPNLLQAARLLADRDIAVRVVAVGQGPDEAEIMQLRDELRLGERVVFTGFRADAVRVMAACDAFVLASQWEGLPVAVMEALALGLPIVATEVGGMAEQLTDGRDALLVPPRDATALAGGIERLERDPDLRHRLARASSERAAEFDIGRAVEYFEAAYEEIATPRPAHVAPARVVPAGVPAQVVPARAGTGHAARSGRRVRPDDGIEIRPASVDDRSAILTLLGRSLGADAGDPRYAQLFAWKHDENRFGRSPTWVAAAEDRVVGVRAFMRWEFERGGEALRAVRAVDTATDPDFQGRGLFTRLTLHGLDQLRDEGIDFVFNTPNAQSRPGYLKMGWREVGRLPAAVRFLGPTGVTRALRSRVPAERWSIEIDVGQPVADWIAGDGANCRPSPAPDVRTITTRIDDDFLAWRFGTPLLHYRVIDDGTSAAIVRARRRGAATELALVAEFGDQGHVLDLATEAARQIGADYVIRLGPANTRSRSASSRSASSRSVPLPGGGPILTWRDAATAGMPPLSNWSLSLGDVELF